MTQSRRSPQSDPGSVVPPRFSGKGVVVQMAPNHKPAIEAIVVALPDEQTVRSASASYAHQTGRDVAAAEQIDEPQSWLWTITGSVGRSRLLDIRQVQHGAARHGHMIEQALHVRLAGTAPARFCE